MRAPLIACIGGAHLDRHAMLHAPSVPGTSNPGSILTDDGGVARNVAVNLARLGCPVVLCSRVGNDESGRRVLAQPLDTSLVSTSETRPTASYTAILEPNGELVLGLADMDIYEELTPSVVEPALPRLREAALWFLDANLPEPTIAWLLDAAGRIPTAVDALVAGVLFGLTHHLDLFAATRLGLAAAAITVESERSTSPNLSREALSARA